MEDNSIEQKSKELVSLAVELNATDIHFLPKRRHTSIYFRVGQQLMKMEEIPKKLALKLISHFKFVAGMDIAEHRRPQNGAMEYIFKHDLVSLRISVIPSSYYESLVIRLLPQKQTHSLSNLALFPSITDKLNQLTKRSNGLIIITGPTGAGKTTTLYSMLYAMKEQEMRSIITLEDPVEKKTDSFIQIEVNEKAGLNYVEGLKAILRHDPDIIMIGEIRDVDTARLAIRASLTGHLVLTTMHTKNSIGAIFRLLEFGIPLHDIEQTLICVIAQRLVQLDCPICKNRQDLHCDHIDYSKVKAIFEILTENELLNIFQLDKSMYSKVTLKYDLKKQFIKALALGFISESSFEKWLGDASGKEKMEGPR